MKIIIDVDDNMDTENMIMYLKSINIDSEYVKSIKFENDNKKNG